MTSMRRIVAKLQLSECRHPSVLFDPDAGLADAQGNSEEGANGYPRKTHTAFGQRRLRHERTRY